MKRQNKKAEIDKYTSQFEKNGYGYRTTGEDTTRIIKVLDHLGISCWQGMRILDFGCGTGTFTRHIGKTYSQVIGSDIVFTNLKIVKSIDNNVEYICSDGNLLPFKNEVFDAVFCGTVLHHFPDISDPLKEIRRVLIPNGVLFAAEPNKWNPITYYKHHNSIKEQLGMSVNEHALSYIELRKNLERLNYKVLNIRGIDFTPHSNAKGFWKLCRILEPFFETMPIINLFGGGLIVTAMKERI
jgi:ubiquinone/menaquinone biosynthesis C-methylase UbiE